jgi:hypothetical protein
VTLEDGTDKQCTYEEDLAMTFLAAEFTGLEVLSSSASQDGSSCSVDYKARFKRVVSSVAVEPCWRSTCAQDRRLGSVGVGSGRFTSCSCHKSSQELVMLSSGRFAEGPCHAMTALFTPLSSQVSDLRLSQLEHSSGTPPANIITPMPPPPLQPRQNLCADWQCRSACGQA